MTMKRTLLAIASVAIVLFLGSYAVAAYATGYASRQPVIAGACTRCVWGPLSEFVKAAMRPLGYDIRICYNCNEVDSPRYVAYGWRPHPLTAAERADGSPPPPAAPVDFGVTDAEMLIWSYNGRYFYAKDGAQHQLRLVAKIEDPVYFVIAAKKSSGITDLSKLQAEKRPITILTDGGPWVEPVLRYYGITEKNVESWGGRFDTNIMADKKDQDFDLIVSSIGSDGNNYESNVWTEMSQKYDLIYFPLPQALRKELARKFNGTLVDLPIGYFRGVDAPIATLGRSGEAVYGRTDMPAAFGYMLAKAIYENRGRLKWLIRPFSYDSDTVWKDGNVPLNPGAARYYRSMGFMK